MYPQRLNDKLFFMYYRLFISALFFLTGCGFHLAKVNNYSLNIDQITPISERQIFSSFANTEGLDISHDKIYTIKNLKYDLKYIANKNTGNIWRQYNVEASWILVLHKKEIFIHANEVINLSSNQSPNEMNFTNLYNPLRRKLLYYTYLEIRKEEVFSSSKDKGNH